MHVSFYIWNWQTGIILPDSHTFCFQIKFYVRSMTNGLVLARKEYRFKEPGSFFISVYHIQFRKSIKDVVRFSVYIFND